MPSSVTACQTPPRSIMGTLGRGTRTIPTRLHAWETKMYLRTPIREYIRRIALARGIAKATRVMYLRIGHISARARARSLIMLCPRMCTHTRAHAQAHAPSPSTAQDVFNVAGSLGEKNPPTNKKKTNPKNPHHKTNHISARSGRPCMKAGVRKPSRITHCEDV